MQNKTINKLLKDLEKELNEKYLLSKERLEKSNFKITAFYKKNSLKSMTINIQL